jgi:hypothetical protein
MILIDGDGLVYTYGFAAEKKQNGVVELMEWKFVAGLLNQQLETMHELTGDGDRKIFLDGGSNYRNDVATIQKYKGHRDRGSRPQYYQAIREYLLEKHGAELVVGQEPDDELGILATELGEEAVIATLDKDLNMIPGKHLNWRKGIITNITEEEGYRFFWGQCIEGDSCDHIPSVYTQMVLLGNEQHANKIKHGSYLKKSKEALTKCNTYALMKAWVEEYYESLSIPKENLEEVGRLLWIRRKRDEEWSLNYEAS